MKLTVIFMLALCGYAGTGAYAQTITLTLHHASLQDAFKAIEQKSGYTFIYTSRVLRKAPAVDFEVSNAAIDRVLQLCLQGQPLTYTILDKLIIIKAKNAALQPGEAQGVVLNEKGDPVSGVMVVWKETGKTTTTDDRGIFSLPAAAGNAVLAFSGVNIEPAELATTGGPAWEVHVKTKVRELSPVEIVSNGYQDISTKNTTGSFFKADNELINRGTSPNILERLYYVTGSLDYEPQNVNTPGKSAVSIRGISTINANMNPLVVVDNFPYSGDINAINPADIESVTVLKDAVAAAIWGVQAGNGVIVIVTKKGKFGQGRSIHFNSSVTVGGKPDVFYFPVISSSDYLGLEQGLYDKGFYNPLINDTINYPVLSQGVELLQNHALPAAGRASQLNALAAADVRRDVLRYFLQNSINQQYAINVSGGADKYTYYFSAGYDRDRSSSVGNLYQRLTARSDNSFRPLKNLELNAYLVYTQAETQNNAIDFTTLLPTGNNDVLAPYTRLADAQGNALAIPKNYRLAYVDTAAYPALTDWHYRPLDELRNNDRTIRQWDTRAGVGIKYTFIPCLSTEVKYQYEKGMQNGSVYNSPEAWYTRNLFNQYMQRDASGSVTYPVPAGGILDLINSELDAWNLRGQINFNRSRKAGAITAFAGAEIRQATMDAGSSRKYGYNPEVNTFSRNVDYNTKFLLRPSGYGPVPDAGSLLGTTARYISYYTRLEYRLKNRYTLSASGRVDESNFFGVRANQRWVPLWSAGAGWELSNEPFYHFRWLPYLKLRATYGYNGNTNNNATSFAVIRYLDATAFSLTPLPYAQIVSPPNPELRWERIRIVNLGIDFETAGKNINGSIEYYMKTGLDLISQVSVDPTTGFSSYTGNNASIKGSGMDMVVNSGAGTGPFRWMNRFVLSYTTDKVTSYQQAGTVYDYISGNKAPFVGRPLFSLYSYKWAGLNPANGDPRGWLGKSIADYNTVVSKSTPSDLVYNGPLTPRVFGSFINTFRWKGLALSMNITWKLGYYFRRSSINYSHLLTQWGGHSDYTLRWQKTGDEARTNVPSLPAAVSTARDQMYLYSDILVEKADQVRWQDIRLSYDMDKHGWRKLPVKTVQFYVNINNIGILWRANRQGIDPDYGSLLVPPARSVAIGISAGF